VGRSRGKEKRERVKRGIRRDAGGREGRGQDRAAARNCWSNSKVTSELAMGSRIIIYRLIKLS